VAVLTRTLEQIRGFLKGLEAGRSRQLGLTAELDALVKQQSGWPESLCAYALPKIERLRQRPPTEDSERELGALRESVQAWPRPAPLPQLPPPPVPVPLPQLEPLALSGAGGTRPRTEAPSIKRLAERWAQMDPGR
jgi:hypothetical protein